MKARVKPAIDNKVINNLNSCAKIDNYEKILDCYESLAGVRKYLGGIQVVDKQHNSLVDARSIVLQLLNDGYKGSKSNQEKEIFLNQILGQYIFLPEANKNYVISVAHSLWLEKNLIVPWSLRGYTQDEIDLMFRVNEVFAENETIHTTLNEYVPNSNRLMVLNAAYPVPLTAYEASFKLFNLAKKHQKENQRETIIANMGWMAKNFFHGYDPWPFDTYKENGGVLVAGQYFPASMEHLFQERIVGCGNMAYPLTAMLRSLNIPAVMINLVGHSTVYVPSINRYIYTDSVLTNPLVPFEAQLLTPEQLNVNYMGQDIYDNIFGNSFPSSLLLVLRLSRENNNLYFDVPLGMCRNDNISDADLAMIRNQAPEYNLRRENCHLISDQLPIQSLESLSN